MWMEFCEVHFILEGTTIISFASTYALTFFSNAQNQDKYVTVSLKKIQLNHTLKKMLNKHRLL